MRRIVTLALLLVSSFAFAQKAAPLSDALTVSRPKEGEYFGVYLQNQKVGWMYVSVKLNAAGDQAISLNELHFRSHPSHIPAERCSARESMRRHRC